MTAALIASYTRDAHELECLAAQARAGGDDAYAVLLEQDAAVVQARVATLERADGLAFGAPTVGGVA